MEAYTEFAQVYDLFMEEIDYDVWAEHLIGLLRDAGIRDGLVCDLCCGTGEITERLAAAGYDMIGIDASAEMLEKAIAKRDVSGRDILYLQQDAREFELYGTVCAVISTCDSLNYVTEPAELAEVFRLVNNYLDPGGLFLFDLNTARKYEKIGDETIAENRPEGSFIWENAFDPETQINEYLLTLFLPEPQSTVHYRKVEEYHAQRAYESGEIRTLLERAGMTYVSAYDGYTSEPAREGSERLFYVARECGKTAGTHIW